MKPCKPRVLLGPMFSDRAESVSAVNRVFVSGLSDRYRFICSHIKSRHGNTSPSAGTLPNCWHTCRQAILWAWKLLHHRPRIAHYAVSSGWAMEKSLLLLLLARWSGAATFGHLHSGGFLDHWATLPVWRRNLALRQLRKLDGFIVLSEWWRTQISTKIGLDSNRLWVVNNPIDPDFERSALAFPVARTEVRILSMGTMGQAKGVLDLIQASGMLHRTGHHFHLHLAGPERETGIAGLVENGIARESIANRVSLCGPVFDQEKADLYRDCAIFVLPSYYENFPLVVLEAAAAGQAIITTPVGAVPEFFHDGVSALFIPPGDAPAMAEALQRLIENPGERERLGHAARRMFQERLQRERILQSLACAYDSSLLAQRFRATGVSSPEPSTQQSMP